MVSMDLTIDKCEETTGSILDLEEKAKDSQYKQKTWLNKWNWDVSSNQTNLAWQTTQQTCESQDIQVAQSWEIPLLFSSF